MKQKFTLLVFSILSIYISAQNTKNILFLGNSYTEVNNLPLLLKNVAISAGKNITYDSNTPGGHTLQGHFTNGTSPAKIAQGNWDYVVLQEQSQIPSFPDNYVNTNMFPYAKKLDSLINKYNPCAETVFYMTWGRKNGDASNCPTLPTVCTYVGMDNAIKTRYEMMAQQNQAIVSPVGAVWRYIRNNYPAIELYSSDESHPSLEGSYAAACAFYTVLFRDNPENITFNSTLNATTAQQIRWATKAVVYDAMSTWNVGKYDVHSQFTSVVSTSNPLTVQFNAEYNYPGATYLWSFGDGQTSNQKNPIHSYTADGVYTVNLKVSKCGTETYESKNITVSQLSTQEIKAENLSFFPNPAQDIIEIKNGKNVSYYEIYDAGSRLIQNGQPKENYINIQHLSKGIYIIRFKNKQGEPLLQSKLIKQ
ncbi:MAG: PKD domain-containing protein [Bacteroidetes bacterium]|nr:PKD domain-containing protein [Bacteroidota bacterium]